MNDPSDQPPADPGPRTVALLAGGLGTRIAAVTGGKVPKAMLEVAGRPFIDHKFDEFRRLGVDRVVMLLATHSEQIVDHIGDGERWGLRVETVLDGEELLGTGGCIRRALPSLGERFWVTYGDTLLDADLAAAERLVDGDGDAGVMTVLRNEDRWEPSNVTVHDGMVTDYSKGSPAGTHLHIDYGYLYLPASAFRQASTAAFDLRVVLEPMIATRRLHAAEVTEPFREIGTPDALAATERWLQERGA